jgi:hypothetical protein
MRTGHLAGMVVVLMLALLDLFPRPAMSDWDGCNFYYNSRIVNSMEFGTYCGSTGPGCKFCYKLDGQSYCYSTSSDGCPSGPYYVPPEG